MDVPKILSKIYFYFHIDNLNDLHVSLTFLVLLTPDLMLSVFQCISLARPAFLQHVYLV